MSTQSILNQTQQNLQANEWASGRQESNETTRNSLTAAIGHEHRGEEGVEGGGDWDEIRDKEEEREAARREMKVGQDQQQGQRHQRPHYINMPPDVGNIDGSWPEVAATKHRPTLERLPEAENEHDHEQDQQRQQQPESSTRPGEFVEGCQHDYVNVARPSVRTGCQPPGARMDLEQQLNLLRDLLAIERANNEQRHQNNLTMKRYLQRLQEDYLRLQSDLVHALELGHKLKAQKESQITCLESNLAQKEALIGQLHLQLNNLDESKLRAEFKSALDKQQALHQLEQEQLRQQVATSEQQLCHERVMNSQLLQQFQEKLDHQLRLHERELASMKLRLGQSQDDLERILAEPQNLLVKALREDKSRLDGQVEELNLALEESRNKYDSMRKRLELVLVEQDRLAQQNQEELDRVQSVSVDQRRALNELRCELEDKQEMIQLMDFNLQRSEKRVKNLLASLKNKEATYRELIGQLEMKQSQELERLNGSLQSTEKQRIQLESELSAKQNELLRLRLEHENQLESLRNDRDERLAKLTLDKSGLVKELQAVELKLARECEQSNQRAKLVEQLRGEAQQFREESKRLSIELTKSEAKLYAEQQELQAAMNRLAEREAEQVADLDNQNRLTLVQRELDEERGHSKRLKTNVDELTRNNEKLQAKLRIAEANLDKTRSAINREHEKMIREYEKKMESIRSEQAAFDRNKLRYKRYGFKLKKYCEHLKRVHEHLCSPNNCGYIIGPNSSRKVASSAAKVGRTVRTDTVGLLDSDGDELYSDSPYYDDISGDEDELECSHQQAAKSAQDKSSKSHQSPPDRFIIKRTGLSPAQSSPMLGTKHQTTAAPTTTTTRYQCSRAPLRSKSTNLVSFEDVTGHNPAISNNTLDLLADISRPRQPNRDEHSYYYIKDQGSTKISRPEAEKSEASKLARSKKIVTINR